MDDLGALLYDETFAADVVFNGTTIEHDSGSFYHPLHELTSAVTIKDCFLSSSALWPNANESDETYSILKFGAVDDVSIINLVVNFSYNVDDECAYSHEETNAQMNDNATARYEYCTDPMTLIENYGQIAMNDTQIDVTFVNVPKHSDSTYDTFTYHGNGEGFIINYGVIAVQNMTLQVE